MDVSASTEPVRLHVETSSTGTALVLTHNFKNSARNFRPQTKVFATTHRIILYNAHGHARSEAPNDPSAYELEHLIDDFERVTTNAGETAVITGRLSLGSA